MGRIVGIDLGTTNSVVAVMDRNGPVVVPNGLGDRLTPSVVGFAKSGEILIGKKAKRAAVMNVANSPDPPNDTPTPTPSSIAPFTLLLGLI